MEKKYIIGGIVLIVLFGLLTVLVVAGGYGIISTSNDGVQRYTYECDVNLKEAFIGKSVSIESASCTNTGVKCGSLFSLFTAKGKVQLYDDTGKVASKDFETGLFSGSDRITLTGCSTGNSQSIRLYDDDGNLQDTKSV